MTKRRLLLVGIVVVALVLAAGAPRVVDTMTQLLSANPVIGDNPPRDAGGVVRADPRALLASAIADLRRRGSSIALVLNLDAYALARALRSEHGRESEQVRRWVAWSIRNYAAGRSIFSVLTTSRASSSGLFADQVADARYAATGQAPTIGDLAIAVDVLMADKSSDPTRGATNFFSPKTQDLLFARAQAGDPKYAGKITKNAQGVRTSWAANGLVSRGAPPGTPSDVVEFFGRGVA